MCLTTIYSKEKLKKEKKLLPRTITTYKVVIKDDKNKQYKPPYYIKFPYKKGKNSYKNSRDMFSGFYSIINKEEAKIALELIKDDLGTLHCYHPEEFEKKVEEKLTIVECQVKRRHIKSMGKWNKVNCIVSKKIIMPKYEGITKKILIVEDDLHLSQDLKYFVEDRGHKTTVCSNIESVLKIWKEIHTYDTIILGLMMLKSKEFKTTKEEENLDTGEILYNRILKEYPKKYIIILTSKSKDNINIKLTKNIPYIQKPLIETKLKELLNII